MRDYKHIINVFSKTKQTKFEFTDRVPTAAFDMVNDEFLINETFFKHVSDKIEKSGYTYQFSDDIAFYFLLGHELGHQWWTVHDISRFKEPISFYKFVQNVVEDTYIEPAWFNYMDQIDILEMRNAMRIGRLSMCDHDYCKNLESQPLTIEIRLQMLIAYSYNKLYQWSVEFLPKHILDFFHEIVHITDDNLRLDKEVEFADMLLDFFGEQYQSSKSGSEPSEDTSDEDSDMKQKIQKALDQISPEFKPNDTFDDQKDVEGTVIGLKDLEKMSQDKVNYYFNANKNIAESSLFKSLLINFNGTFNKYKFRTYNGMSYNERKGEVDMHNIPFSNVRTDFFKKQNNYKREFDLEFVLLFDFSGSMNSIKSIVSDIGASFSLSCIQNKIPITSLAFTDESTLLFNSQQRNKEYIKNIFFNARNDITGGTDFLYGIRYATNLLSKSLKKDKVIIILTDGDTMNEQSIRDVIEKFDGLIIPISIDQDNPQQFDRLFKRFDKFYYSTHEVMSKLPYDLITYIYKKFMKGGVLQ